MTNMIHRVNIDVVRGFEQKDTRWDDFSMVGFKDSQDPYAFWEVNTAIQPGRNDLRQLAKTRGQGIRAGERPGTLPSAEFAPFTTTDPNACNEQVMYDDRVATLRLVRPLKKGKSQTSEVIRMMGEERVVSQEISNQPTSPLKIDPEGVEILLETNSFLLQGARELFQEKYQISETFGEPVFFAFGKRQQIFQYDGMVFDTQSWQWKEKFINDYETYLRGTKAVESGAIAILTTTTAIVRGYLLSCSIGQTDATHGYAALSFAMFVVDRFPIEDILRSPQEIHASMAEDPAEAFFTVNDRTAREGEVIKRVTGGAASVILPNGFTAENFGTLSGYTGGQDTHVRPSSPVAGEQSPIQLNMPGPHNGGLPVGTYDPPDLVTQPMSGKYLNVILKARLGRVGLNQRKDLQAPPGTLEVSGYSMAPTEPWQSPSDTSPNTSLLHHAGGVAGANRHSLTQINGMKELFQKGVLVVEIAAGPSGLAWVQRRVSAFRQFGDPGFQSIDNRMPNLGLGGLFGPNAFEIELDKPITPGDVGLASFNHSTRFKMEVWEDKVFLVRPASPELIYHSISPTKLRRVATADTVPAMVSSTDRHIFRDPAADFVTSLGPSLAAGDKVYIQFPFPVADSDEPTDVPTAKVRVRTVISPTELQLGLLRLTSPHGLQPAGQVDFTGYTITVERGSMLKLNESVIREDVRNPPTGAFDNIDISVAKVQSPRGVFKLEEGKHYTK